MTTLINLINQFRSIGVQLQIDGNDIKYFIPKTVKQEHPEINQLLTELKIHKAEAIQLLSQQKKAWVEPNIEFLTDHPETIMLWSDMLNDYWWYCSDKNTAIKLRMQGIPVYDDGSIKTMILLTNGGYDVEHARHIHHGFKQMAMEHRPNYKSNKILLSESKPTRAILLWSDKLQDHFWWLIDKSALPEIQKDGIPIYDNDEINVMLNARNNIERQILHSFKKTFNATICKNKINDERR